MSGLYRMVGSCLGAVVYVAGLAWMYMLNVVELSSVQSVHSGDCVFLCELSSLQKALYTILTEQEDFKLVAKSQDLCACNSGEQQGYCCQVVSSVRSTVECRHCALSF